MTWNYQLVRKEHPQAAPDERVELALHEVYWDATDEDACHRWAVEPEVSAFGKDEQEARENLRQALLRMLLDTTRPILAEDGDVLKEW